MMYLIQEETLTNIADKLREKGNLDGAKLTPAEMADAVGDVYEKGKQAEYNAFWDEYQAKGTRYTYPSAFFGYWWTDNIYNPKYDIVNTQSTSSMYQASRIKDTKVNISVADGVDCSNMFFNCREMKTIRCISVNETNKFSKTFQNCDVLENITFDGVIGSNIDLQWSKKLTRASIESIMAHLWSCGYEYNENLYTKCEWNGTTLVCSIVDRYGDPIEVDDALITVYNANTGEGIASNWAVGHSAVEFPYLDKSIVYAVVATDVIDAYGYERGTATVAYSDGNSPWESKTLTLSLTAVDTAFGDEIDVGSVNWAWHQLVLAHPEWVISLV